MANTANRRFKWLRRVGGVFFLLLVGVLTIVVASGFILSRDDSGKPKHSTAVHEPTVVKPASAQCASTWQMDGNTPENHNWVKDGVPSIQHAKAEDDARKAANDWLDQIKTSPGMLAGASQYLPVGQKVDPSTLADVNGCATPAAQALFNQLQGVLGLAKVEPGTAPADAYNSGTDNGNVVVSANPGIGGNRKAIKITTLDGHVVWVMARCGNPVTLTRPPLPPPPPNVLEHCTSGCENIPPPCRTNCGPPPSCKTNCSPPPCTTNCGPPPCTHNCTPPPPCNTCVTKTQVNQPVQDNHLVEQSGVNLGPTKGVPTQAPPKADPVPVNNHPGGNAAGQKAPDPTPSGSNSGHSDDSGTPSGTSSDSGGTTVNSGPTNQPVNTNQGGTNNSGMPSMPT